MEKGTPHCRLSVVRTLVEQRKARATRSALRGAAELGMDFSDMLGVVLALTPRDFYKSMTTHADHRIWQDVYRPRTWAGDVLIVSFKEL